jgi:hypothetical protein
VSEVVSVPPAYWSRERVEAEVARGFPRFMAEARQPPSASFDRNAPRAPLVPLAPEPRTEPAAPVRPVPPAIRPAPRPPRAAAPSSQGSLL